jgi:hypothetical protein
MTTPAGERANGIPFIIEPNVKQVIGGEQKIEDLVPNVGSDQESAPDSNTDRQLYTLLISFD